MGKAENLTHTCVIENTHGSNQKQALTTEV